MIGLMEKQGKYSVTTFESFKNELKGSYGDMSLKWNAALAMFLSADPDEQEVWIQRLIAAKRTAGSKTTLERVRELADSTPQSATENRQGPASVSSGEQLRAGVRQALAADDKARRAKSSHRAPPKAAG
jgi:hypothetical protein